MRLIQVVVALIALGGIIAWIMYGSRNEDIPFVGYRGTIHELNRLGLQPIELDIVERVWVGIGDYAYEGGGPYQLEEGRSCDSPVERIQLEDVILKIAYDQGSRLEVWDRGSVYSFGLLSHKGYIVVFPDVMSEFKWKDVPVFRYIGMQIYRCYPVN